MNVDQTLLQEVESLLAEPRTLKTKPSTPSNKLQPESQPSVFHATWNLITNPFEKGGLTGTKSNLNNNPEDYSDLTASLSGLNNIYKCDLPEDDISLHSFKLSETGFLSRANLVGPPSMQESNAEVYDDSNEGSLTKPSRVNNKISSRILAIQSKLGINQSSKDLGRQSSSNGLNLILDSNTSVGSTHRASVSNIGPRCAYDYIMKVQRSECERRKDDIPTAVYKYMDANCNFTQQEKMDSGTPILKDTFAYSPINKSFLDHVNEQIQQIKYQQAREKQLLIQSSGEIGDSPRGISKRSSHLVTWGDQQYSLEASTIGTSNSTTQGINPSSVPILKTKVDFTIQTDLSEPPSSVNSPNPWGGNSNVDSQISLTGLKSKKLGCRNSKLKQSFYPLSPDSVSEDCMSRPRRLPRTRISRSSNLFGNILNFNNAMGVTRYSLQAAWNTAEEIFYGYIVPPEIEDEPPIEDDMAANEDKMAVSVMRLMGVSVDTRHAIYREVLGEIQAINDFSVGTVHALTHLIDWICTGNHGGAADLVAKTRLLCSSQTEVDPDSETWKGFERDMRIFTNAVVNTVGNAAKAVSRQNPNDSNDSLLTNISAPASETNLQLEEQENQNGDSTGPVLRFKNPVETDDDVPDSPTTDSVDYDAPVNPELMSQLVTESEFDLPITPVPRTESTTSRASTPGLKDLSRRRSRIPIRIQSNKSQDVKDIDEDFNLNVLKSTLHVQSEAYPCRTRSSKLKFDSPSRKSGTSLSRQGSNSGQTNRTDQIKRGIITPGSSNYSLPGMSKSGLKHEDLREQRLNAEDTLLLKECRRLTSMSTSESSPHCSTTTGRLFESRYRSPSTHHASVDNNGIGSPSPGQDQSILSGDISQLASAIASVATSVTSTLLSRATSAASYIPSFGDTFGPQGTEQGRFPENLPDSSPSLLDTLQQAASNAIFGYDEPLDESGLHRMVRSDNRLGAPHREDNQNVNQTSGIQSISSNDNELLDPAWELFDYIKKGESSKQTAGRKFSEQGILDETPPDYVRTPPELPEPSVTARLSKAALTGLFNTFTESIPITSSNSGINGNNPESCIQPRSSPSPTQCIQGNLNYRTVSGHNYPVNSRNPSMNCNRMSTNHFIRVPKNSDTEFTRNVAENRMQQDLAYLEDILKNFYSDTLTKKPATSNKTNIPLRSRSHQQATQGTKIPTFRPSDTKGIVSKVTKPSSLPRKSNAESRINSDNQRSPNANCENDSLTTTYQFCTGPGNKSFSRMKNVCNTERSIRRPKIIHPTASSSPSGLTPMKPKVQVINANPKPSVLPRNQRSTVSSGANSNIASRTPSQSNAINNSYLTMARNKEKVANRPAARGTGSYSSSNRHHLQYPQEGMANRKNDKYSARRNRDGQLYKSDDGTYSSNPESGHCSSTCSSGLASPYSYPMSPGTRAYQVEAEYHDTTAPLFFPSLDNSGLSIPPLLINPLGSFRESVEKKSIAKDD